MTDNLPAKDQKREVRLPVIVCPFCGEKDPHKLALITVNRDYGLEMEIGCGQNPMNQSPSQHIKTAKSLLTVNVLAV